MTTETEHVAQPRQEPSLPPQPEWYASREFVLVLVVVLCVLVGLAFQIAVQGRLSALAVPAIAATTFSPLGQWVQQRYIERSRRWIRESWAVDAKLSGPRRAAMHRQVRQRRLQIRSMLLRRRETYLSAYVPAWNPNPDIRAALVGSLAFMALSVSAWFGVALGLREAGLLCVVAWIIPPVVAWRSRRQQRQKARR